MKKLFFLHTQTSSLQKNYEADVRDYKSWSRLVAITWHISNEHLDYSQNNRFLIRPIGFNIESDAEEINGFTNEDAINDGKPIQYILDKIKEIINNVDYFVGHNIEYHLKVLRSEMIRNGYEDFPNIKTICLMKLGVEICNIKLGGKNKFPTLNELHISIFKKDIVNQESQGLMKIDLFLKTNIACYKYMYEKGLFINYGIIPEKKINIIKIPFRKDNYPNIKYINIVKNNSSKFDILINNVIVYDQVENFEEFEPYGVYLFQKIKNNEIEYYLTDYRGVLIYKTLNREISITRDIFEQYFEISVDSKIIAEVSDYQHGVILHQDKAKFVGSYYSEGEWKGKCFLLIEHNSESKSLIDRYTGEIIYRGVDLYIDGYFNKIITIKEQKATVWNLDFTYFGSFNLQNRLIKELIKFDNLILFVKDGKQGIMDVKGQVIIDNKYQYIEYIENSEGCFYYTNSDVYGIININKKVIYESNYYFSIEVENDFFIISNLVYDSKNQYWLNEGAKKGIIDFDGTVVAPFEFDDIELNEDEEFFNLSKNNKRGLYLIFEKAFIDALYDKLEIETSINTNKKIIFSTNDNLHGLIDSNGYPILNCEYLSIFTVDDDFKYIKVKNKENGEFLIDLEDNYKTVLQDFDSINAIHKSDDVIYAVTKNDSVKFKNLTKNFETEFLYDDLSKSLNFYKNEDGISTYDRRLYLPYFRFNNDRLIALKNGLYGFLNKNLEEIIPFKFDLATPFKDGYAKVSCKGESFQIDVYGTIVKNL